MADAVKIGGVYVSYASKGLEKLHKDFIDTGKEFKLGAREIVSGAAQITAAIAGLGAAAAGIAIKYGIEFDAVESRLSATVGNVEKNMLQVRDLFRTGLVNSVEEAGAQATAAIRAFGQETDAEIRQSLKFGAAITEQFQIDSDQLFSGVKTLIDEFGLTSEKALDLVATGFQKGLDRSGDFLDSINEYAVQFSNAGADAGQFFSLLETGLQGGVLGTDKAADAFKEFRVRIQDGSTATETALAQIGLNMEEVNKQLSTGAVDVIDVFGDVLTRLRETDDSTIQMQAGVGLLGTMFEDLGTEAVLALDLAATGMDDVSGAAERTFETTQTAQRLFDQLVNEGILIAVDLWEQYEDRVKDALAGTLEFVRENREWPVEMANNISEAWDWINVGFVALMDVVGTGWIEQKHAGEIAWAAVKDAAGESIAAILKGASNLTSGVAQIYNAIGAYDLAGPATRASMQINMAVRDMEKWSTNLEKATDARDRELSQHNAIIDAMISERAEYKGIEKAATEANQKLEKIFTERENASKDTVTEIIKTETDGAKKIVALTAKQVADIEKAEKERIKDHEKMLDEIEKLEEKQFDDFEKQLEKGRDAYEKWLKDQTGLKELSTETIRELDERYAEFYADIQDGLIDEYDDAQQKLLGIKELGIDDLKAADEEYAAFLAKTEAENRDIRLEFYKQSGNFSEEYYAAESQRIQTRVAELQAAGADAVAVSKWENDQIAELNIKRLQMQDDFWSGMQLAVAQSEKDWMSWADAGGLAVTTLQDAVKTGIGQVANSVSVESGKMKVDWDGVWSGMLQTVVGTLGEIAGQMAAQGIAKGAMAIGEWLFAEEGAFDIGRTGPGKDMGGAIPVMAHPGESILTAELTQGLKDAVNFDEWLGSFKEHFGLGQGDAAGLFSQAADYKGAGASLWKAYQAFEEGNEIGGTVEAMNALSEAFTAYGQQNASQAAVQIGQGLGDAAGAIGAGYGAVTAFEAENYFSAATQALQAVQSAASLYSTVTGTAAPGIGAIGSVAGYATGAGYGLAAWNLLGTLGEIEGAQKAAPQWGAAIAGAVIGGATGGAFGAIAGGIMGGIGGLGIEVAGEDEFDLDELDNYINQNRQISGGRIGTVPPSVDPSWFGVTQQKYYGMLNLQAGAVNSLADTITAALPPDDAEKFNAALQSNLETAIGNIQSGGNYNRNRADMATAAVASFWWDKTIDAIESSISDFDFDGKPEIQSLIDANRPDFFMNPLDPMAGAKLMEERRAAADPFFAAQLAERERTAAERLAGGGAAMGGLIVPAGEDGILAARQNEFVVNEPGVKFLSSLINQQNPFGLFGVGGVMPEANERTARGVDIFGGDMTAQDANRAGVMSELLLNDLVTSSNQHKEISRDLLTQIVEVLRQILQKPVPQLSPETLAGVVAGPLQNGARTGQYVFSSPVVIRAAEHTLRQPARAW